MPLNAARTLLCGPRYALSFNGVNNYIEAPDSDSLDTIGEMTIGFWLYLDDITTEQELMGHGVFRGGGWLMIKSIYNLNNLHLEIEDYTGGTPIRCDGILSFGWHFYAVTYDDDIDTVQFFKDGVLFKTATCTRSMTATTLPLRIGTVAKGSYLSGKIGGVLIYSRALSDKEIAWNFNHRDNPVRNGLVLWLHWDSIDIDAGKWYDKSAFGNHGTIYGATLVEPIRLKARTLSPVRSLSPAR